jgi:hypothetical protein
MRAETPFNPFPGLRPFRTDEDYLFFGREGQSEEILRRLRLNRFLAVVGTSGSGKSSLVRAGLLPYIFGGFMSGAGSHWRVAVLRPGSDPIGNLARALNDPAVLGEREASTEDASRDTMLLEVTLRRSGLGLIEAVRLSRLPETDNVLVVVDQFEELFRFATASSTVRRQDDAAAFVKLLVEASLQTSVPIYVAVTMRSDFIGDCARFRDLPEAVTAGLYLIPRMTREQRREAIEQPIRVGHAQISRRLINRVLNDGGDDPDQLPALQHALMRTWNYWARNNQDGGPIDLDHYAAVGGISEALSRHAEEAYSELPDTRHREIARRLFQSLTEKEQDNREVRRPTKLGDIAALAGAETSEVVSAIEYFRREGRSFLTPPPDVPLEPDSVIDISHESLIRGWDRLRKWVEEESDSAKVYRRLAETAALHSQGRAGLWHDPDLANALLWREREKPTAAWAKPYHPGFDEAMAFLDKSRAFRDAGIAEEARRRKRELFQVRAFAAAISVLFLLAAVTAYQAKMQYDEAKREERQAQADKSRAQAAEQKAVNAENQALRNLVAAQTAENQARQKQLEADSARQRADHETLLATANQNMALEFGSNTVRTFSGLDDFILSQNTTQDQYESLLRAATRVHDNVLDRENSNFQAMVMRANTWLALIRLHSLTGQVKGAHAECDLHEKDARKLVEPQNSYIQRLIGAYLLAETARTRMSWNEKDLALAGAASAVKTVDAIGDVPPNDNWDDQVWRCRSIAYTESAIVEDHYGLLDASLKHYQSGIEALEAFDRTAASRRRSQRLSVQSRQVLVDGMKGLAEIQVRSVRSDIGGAEGLGESQAASKRREMGFVTYSKAIALASGWTSTREVEPKMVATLASLYMSRGDARRASHEPALAEQDYELARQASEKLDKSTTQYRNSLAFVKDRYGSLLHEKANLEEDPARRQELLQAAVRAHEEALNLFREMEQRRGRNPGLEVSIGIDEQNLAWDYNALADVPKTRDKYNASLVSYRFAAQLSPSDDVQGRVAFVHSYLGLLESDNGRTADALANYRKAVEERKKIENPDADSNHQLLVDMRQVAELQLRPGTVVAKAAALRTYSDAIAKAEDLIKGDSPAPSMIRDLVWMRVYRGDIHATDKRFTDAQNDFSAADNAVVRMDLNSVDGNLSRSKGDAEKDAALKNQHYKNALELHTHVLRLRREIETVEKTAQLEHNLGVAEHNVAADYLSLADLPSTRTHYLASAAAYEASAVENPVNQAFVDAAGAHRIVITVATLMSNQDEALSSARRVVELQKKISGPDEGAQHQLLVDVKQLANLQLKAGKDGGDTAAQTYSDAIASALRWDSGSPYNARRVDDIIWLYLYRGDIRRDAKRYAEAEKDYISAIPYVQRLNPALPASLATKTNAVTDRISAVWREWFASEKDPAPRQERLQHVLKLDSDALNTVRQLEASVKPADGQQKIGFAEYNLAVDYQVLAAQEAPARAHYQECVRAYAEAARIAPSDAASRLASQAYADMGQFEFAVHNPRSAAEAFTGQISALKPLADRPKPVASDKQDLAGAYGLRSWANSLAGNFQAALSDADAGISYDATRMFIMVNKADACLLLGRVEEARRIYLEIADKPLMPGSTDTPRKSILEDLIELGRHPEFKLDSRVLSSLQKDLAITPSTSKTIEPPASHP